MEIVSEIIDRVSDNSAHQDNPVSKVVNAKLSTILSELMSSCSDLAGAMVGSTDGQAWAQQLNADLDYNRFAAMSSALLALSDNLISEAHQGDTKNVLLESDGGNIFVMHAGNELLLTVFTKPTSNLGMSLAYAKKAADEIACLHIEQ